MAWCAEGNFAGMAIGSHSLEMFLVVHSTAVRTLDLPVTVQVTHGLAYESKCISGFAVPRHTTRKLVQKALQ